VDWSDGSEGDEAGGGVTARVIGQEALSHSASVVPRCNSKSTSWGTAPTACRDGIAIRKAACRVSGAGGGVLVSLKTETVGKGLLLPSVLLCDAEGVEMGPAALCAFGPERPLWDCRKGDPTKRLIRVFAELDCFGTDVKTSGYSNESITPSDEYIQDR